MKDHRKSWLTWLVFGLLICVFASCGKPPRSYLSDFSKSRLMTDSMAHDFIVHLRNGKAPKDITIDDIWQQPEDGWPMRDFIKTDFSIHALNNGNFAIFCNSIGGTAVHPDAIRMVTYIDIELKTQRLYERSEAEKLLKTP